MDGIVAKSSRIRAELNGTSRSHNLIPNLKRELSIRVGCLYDLVLLVLAFLWGWFFHRPALLHLHWGVRLTLIGIGAAIPPFIVFPWTLKSKLPVSSPHRHLLESLLRLIELTNQSLT